MDDKVIRNNPSDCVMRELKRTAESRLEKRIALTLKQEKIFIDFLKSTPKYRHWYPIFFVMVRTGMRVGECTGLRWEDIDFESGEININHTLAFYSREKQNGCTYGVHPPKTIAGNRIIIMSEDVKQAFIEEGEYQKTMGIKSNMSVDGYSDFVFINCFGECLNNGVLNKALRRIIRDCNDQVILKQDQGATLLPHFSCHNLRHTCATRMCEAGLNIKYVQDTLGHEDIQTTLNIYTDCTEKLKQTSLEVMDKYYNNDIANMAERK